MQLGRSTNVVHLVRKIWDLAIYDHGSLLIIHSIICMTTILFSIIALLYPGQLIMNCCQSAVNYPWMNAILVLLLNGGW